ATILGSAAADLAHLLAELVENALVFSPPDQTVDIRGRARPDGYTLAIIDSGLGMPPADVAAANRRLAGAESFTIAPSKYLGHYVAGNLAARHDINVRLDNSPGNGITATIDIPQSLLTSDGQLLDGAPAPLSRPPASLAPASGGRAPDSPAPLFDLPPAAGAALGPGGGGGQAAWPPPGLLTTGENPAVRPAARAPRAEPTRTASGLVKRARRAPEQDAPAASVPGGDLLASLSSVADNNVGQRRADGPPVVDVPDGVTPPPPIWSALSTRKAGRTTTPPENRSWAVPPAPVHQARPSPSPSSAPGTRPPLAGRPAGPGGAADGGQTPSGLARRVRGAQMPVTQPVNLRRTQEPPRRGDGGYRRDDHAAEGHDHMLGNANGNGNTNGHANGHAHGRDGGSDRDESSTARSVYGFLTSFTQGVQRGLDEARRDPNIPKENS
ncbi:MAG TPA: ATP-binding protein, partial [Acidimicrobiales bacterium]|nr:ATP-binding protein [Acidimicrobiales bacterium]